MPGWATDLIQTGVLIAAAVWCVAMLKGDLRVLANEVKHLTSAVKDLSKTAKDHDARLAALERERAG